MYIIIKCYIEYKDREERLMKITTTNEENQHTKT